MDADVVVVGAGSAGCAVAHRLTRIAGLRVLVVEAGPDYGRLERWPSELLDPTRFPQTHDWGFEEERDDGRALPEPRAKVVGGCSTHNQCAALWPLPDDCELWAQLTDDGGWGYAALRPLVDELEDAVGGDPLRRGSGGVLPTRAYAEDELATWQRAFLDAARAAGFGRSADLSSPEPLDGAAPFQVNTKNGVRWNAALAFLEPRPPGSWVLGGTFTDRLVLERGRCVAVVCRSGDDLFELRPRHVVLSAGVYGSPTVLLRSGVGPARDLRTLGIQAAVDLPAVGQNLHDHPGVALRCRPTSEGRALLERDLARGSFHQSQVALRAGRGTLHVLPYHALVDDGWSFELLAFAMRPASRGSVELRTRNPDDPPRIRFRYLSDDEGRDLASLRAGVALARRLAASPSLAQLARDPGSHDSLEDAFLASAVGGYAHAVGTCAMGSVAESDGRVRGLENVRVADASLVPVIPRQNTNLTAILVGWRVARLLAGEIEGGN